MQSRRRIFLIAAMAGLALASCGQIAGPKGGATTGDMSLGDLKAKVMRVLDRGIIGCNFLTMERRQEIKLDKLVLEVQKRLIELRKAKRAAE